MTKMIALTACLSCLCSPYAAWAQNWSFDARRIALGGVDGTTNLASEMVQSDSGYRTIVVPLGLVQVLRNTDVFKPGSDNFDLVRAIEYAASPVHYVIGRDTTATGSAFVTNVRNGRLSRDLNDYCGFIPVSQPSSEGLSTPGFGKTITLVRGAQGAFHGVYVGAGPYLAMRTDAVVDPQLTALLSAAAPTYLPNAQLRLGSAIRGETALAVTGGYRARLPLATASSSGRDGIYVAVDYHHLRGMRYENADIAVRLDTDAAGLLTYNDRLPSPLAITRDTATSGRGSAVDVGVAAAVNGVEVGFGANGIANRMTWTGVQRTMYTLPSLTSGDASFVETEPAMRPDARVELPVDYRGNLGYRGSRWAATSEFRRGFQGRSFHGGGEYGVAGFTVRGGGLYTRERWQPTAGVGLPLGRRVALDVAMFGTSANIERKRHAAIAMSMRIGRTS